MKTTTITAVMSRAAEVIEAIHPVAEPTTRGFLRNRAPNRPLRPWRQGIAGTAAFRLFDVRPTGERQDGDIEDPAASLVGMSYMVTVAYPTKPALVNPVELYELEALAYSDAHQIHDALRSVGALLTGHEANFVTEKLDQTNEDVWFFEFSVDAVLYTARYR